MVIVKSTFFSAKELSRMLFTKTSWTNGERAFPCIFTVNVLFVQVDKERVGNFEAIKRK